MFDHFVQLHTQLQMRQQTTLSALKLRAQQAIARVHSMHPLLRQSGQQVAHTIERFELFVGEVPENVSLPLLLEETNMMLERTHCSIKYDVDAQFR